MYQYTRAFLRARGRNKKWENVNISNVLLSDLFRNYLDGYITLTNASLGPGEYHVDFVTLKQFHFPFVNVTFETWLGTIGLPVLPATQTEPTYITKHIVYADAIQAGYHVRACKPDIVSPDDEFELYIENQEERLPLEERTDLALSKAGVDFVTLRDRALVSVNGFYHRTIPRMGELQVIDGSRSLQLSQKHLIGITSFDAIGDVQQIAISANMIVHGHPQRPSTFYPQEYGTYLHTGVDMRNKSVGIVLGGILHIEDESYQVINREEGIIKVNIGRVNLPQWAFETEGFMDISPLGLTTSEVRRGSVNIEEMYSNDTIDRFLQLSQSFVVVVDAPLLYRRYNVIGRVPLPGQYESDSEPVFPLKTRYGRLLTYWTRHTERNWLLETESDQGYEYLMNSTAIRTAGVVNNTVNTPSRHKMECVLEGIYSMVKD